MLLIVAIASFVIGQEETGIIVGPLVTLGVLVTEEAVGVYQQVSRGEIDITEPVAAVAARAAIVDDAIDKVGRFDIQGRAAIDVRHVDIAVADGDRLQGRFGAGVDVRPEPQARDAEIVNGMQRFLHMTP